MPKAEHPLVIYRKDIKAIVAELQEADCYHLAATDSIFYGSIEDFKIINPDFKTLEEVLKEDFTKIPRM
jgi:hypothetical protein